MSSARKHTAHADWCDVAALTSSRRYARLFSLLLVSALILPFYNMQAPKLRLPAVQPLVLDMRFQAPAEEMPLPAEERRILADESPFVVPEVETKKEDPPPRTVMPEPAPGPPPKKEREKPRPVRRTPPPKMPTAQQASPPQPGLTRDPPAATVRAEVSTTSRQTALQALVREIERRKHYPSQARRQGAQGTVVLLVRIGADGVVQGCSVDKTCGIPVLDTETARLGEKLAGLHTGVSGAAFAVRVPVRYTLR